MMGNLFVIAITAILMENYVLSRFLGICPFLGVSKKLDTAVGMGAAVSFVMVLATIATWCVQKFLLVPFNLEYLQTIAFILIIASLVQFVEMALMKVMPPLYESLGIYLPLITTNCAVLGSAIMVQTKSYSLIEGIVYSLASAVGFTLAMVLFAGVRERLEESDVPEFMKGFPITLVAASLLSLAFFGFQGLKF